jgi:hypothetical protein
MSLDLQWPEIRLLLGILDGFRDNNSSPPTSFQVYWSNLLTRFKPYPGTLWLDGAFVSS